MAEYGLGDVLRTGPGFFRELKILLVLLVLLAIGALIIKIYKDREWKKELFKKIEEYKTVLSKLSALPHIEKAPNYKFLGRKKKHD